MAEDAHSEEPHVDEPDTPGYKPPAKKTLEEIQKLDVEDESLRKYKEQLLQGSEGAITDPTKGPEMKPLHLVLISEGQEDKEVDLTDVEKLKAHTFIIKEGVEYRMKIVFLVFNDIVCGLKYTQHLYRKGISLEKSSYMLGSYGPKTEPHEYTTASQEAPSGLLSRGTYVCKSKFIDDDKNEYASWSWNFEVKKDWE